MFMGRLIAKIINVENNKQLNRIRRIDGGREIPPVVIKFLENQESSKYIFFVSPDDKKIIRYEQY